MKLTTAITIIAALVGAVAAQSNPPAPVINGNPHMVTFQALLQASKPVQGSLTGVSAGNGIGADLNVNFFSFPDPAIGPFSYHIHVNRVPEDGNCTAAGDHLDPYDVTDAYKCADQPPDSCQLGDLSGKHGKIETTKMTTSSYQISYLDEFLSTIEGNTAFFGNRSVVVHAGNGTRLNCGNFVMQAAVGGYGSGNETTNSTFTSSPPTHRTATGTESTATPTQTLAGSNGGTVGAQGWSNTAIFGMGFVAVAMAAL